MLFWIFVIVAVLGIIGCHKVDSCNYEFTWGCNLLIAIVGVMAVIVSIIVMMCNYIGIDGYIAQMDARYESLTYQYENDIYDNDNDVGKRELMCDIQRWNEGLAQLQTNQDDIWIGIYRPNIYDRFEFIELKGE